MKIFAVEGFSVVMDYVMLFLPDRREKKHNLKPTVHIFMLLHVVNRRFLILTVARSP